MQQVCSKILDTGSGCNPLDNSDLALCTNKDTRSHTCPRLTYLPDQRIRILCVCRCVFVSICRVSGVQTELCSFSLYNSHTFFICIYRKRMYVSIICACMMILLCACVCMQVFNRYHIPTFAPCCDFKLWLKCVCVCVCVCVCSTWYQ